VTYLFRVATSDLQDMTVHAKEKILAQLRIFTCVGLLEAMPKSLICRRYQKNSRRGTQMAVPKLNMIC